MRIGSAGGAGAIAGQNAVSRQASVFQLTVANPVYVTTTGGRRWVYALINGATQIGGRGEQFFNDPIQPLVGSIAVGVTSRGIPPVEAYIYDGAVCEFAWDVNGLGGAKDDDFTVEYPDWIIPAPWPVSLKIG